MMYLFTRSVKNLIGNGRSWLVSGLGVIIFMVFLFYSLFYHTQIKHHNELAENEYLSRAELRFRDELQYLSNRRYTEGMDYFFDESQNFNSDGSMDAYNFAFPLNRAELDQISQSGALSESVYCNEAYTNLPGSSHREKITVYGGNTDTLIRYKDELRRGENYSPVFTVTEGKAAQPGMNECMLYCEFAENNGISVNDIITLYDENGTMLTEFTVTGLLSVYSAGYNGSLSLYSRDELNYTVGSMPFGRIQTTVYRTVFTDFNTAYELFDENDSQNYTFNHYILIFRLDSPEALERLNHRTSEILSSDLFELYPLTGALMGHAEYYEEELCEKVIFVCLVMSAVLLVLTAVLQLHERRNDLLVIHYIGISRRTIIQSYAAENTLFLLLLSALAFVIACVLDRLWKLLGTGFYIDRFRFVLSAEGVIAAAVSLLLYFLLTSFTVLMYTVLLTERRR